MTVRVLFRTVGKGTRTFFCKAASSRYNRFETFIHWTHFPFRNCSGVSFIKYIVSWDWTTLCWQCNDNYSGFCIFIFDNDFLMGIILNLSRTFLIELQLLVLEVQFILCCSGDNCSGSETLALASPSSTR